MDLQYSKVKFSTLTTKKARVACLRERLATNGNWATAGLLKIFAAQTAEEQDSEMTSEHNGVGFTGADAEFLTSLAKQYEARGSLSPKQIGSLYKSMPKYAVQLERISTKS